MDVRSPDTPSEFSDEDLELLSRYIDGEMTPMEARRFERRLDSESSLRDGLVRIEELNHRLRDALAGQVSIPGAVHSLLADGEPGRKPTPVTEGVAAAGDTARKGDSGKVLPFPAQRPAASHPSTRMKWRGALAASIAIAISAGIVLERGDSVSQLPGNDRLVDAALDRLPSGSGWSTLADGRELQPVLTFPHREGNWCREYLLRGDDNWRAVACHDGKRWVTQAAGLESFMDYGAAYRPAGAADAAPVAVFIDQNAADIALDAQAEAELLSRWSLRD